MPYGREIPRPGVLTLVSIVSVFLSVADVFWFVLTTLVLVGVSALSWAGGPAVGAVGTFIAAVLFLIALVRGCLAILLFVAGLRTWQGDPSGRSLHRTWAWTTIVLDAIDLILTWGMSVASWWGLAYAVALLYVMDQPGVRAYFDRAAFGAPWTKPEPIIDDGV